MNSLDMSTEVVYARPKLILMPATMECTTIAITACVFLWICTSVMAVKIS